MAKKEVKEKENETVDEDFKDVKKANKKNPVLKVISILLWLLILAWLVVVIFDFYKVSQEEDPVFCISKETITYDDGTVDLCTGLGYKVYNYNRASISGYEFGPFWIKNVQNSKIKSHKTVKFMTFSFAFFGIVIEWF